MNIAGVVGMLLVTTACSMTLESLTSNQSPSAFGDRLSLALDPVTVRQELILER
jgi:hypothetical protein